MVGCCTWLACKCIFVWAQVFDALRTSWKCFVLFLMDAWIAFTAYPTMTFDSCKAWILKQVRPDYYGFVFTFKLWNFKCLCFERLIKVNAILETAESWPTKQFCEQQTLDMFLKIMTHFCWILWENLSGFCSFIRPCLYVCMYILASKFKGVNLINNKVHHNNFVFSW